MIPLGPGSFLSISRFILFCVLVSISCILFMAAQANILIAPRPAEIKHVSLLFIPEKSWHQFDSDWGMCPLLIYSLRPRGIEIVMDQACVSCLSLEPGMVLAYMGQECMKDGSPRKM